MKFWKRQPIAFMILNVLIKTSADCAVWRDALMMKYILSVAGKMTVAVTYRHSDICTYVTVRHEKRYSENMVFRTADL
jgi:hypothetical protein